MHTLSSFAHFFMLFSAILTLNVIVPATAFSQNGVAINNSGAAADSSAILDVNSVMKGMLMPRMTTAQRNSINNPAQSLIIFNTTTKCFEAYIDSAWFSVSCPTNCQPPASPVSVSGNVNPCPGESGVQYTVTSVPGAVSYTWTVPSGAAITAGQGSGGIEVDFGLTAGNVCVVAQNNCGVSLPYCISITFATAPASPSAGTHAAGQTQIIWNWNAVSGATGYKWNTINDYVTATDNGVTTSYTQTGLTCNTPYTFYVWAYNNCGYSGSTMLSQTTSVCGGKRVFITSTTYTANLGGVTGADNLCQTRADAAGLGGSWKAWISQPGGSSPATRFAQSSSTYMLLNGSVVANNWSDLTDGTIGVPINLNEYNNLNGTLTVWSNTLPDGTFDSGSSGGCGGTVCGSWTIGGVCNNPNCGQSGDASQTTSQWTKSGAACCFLQYSLYCFEQ